MKKMLTLLLLCCVMSVSPSWKVLLYMDSSDDMNDMAIKNITDMIHVAVQDSVEILVQLHSYDAAGLRYKVTKQGLQFLEEIVLAGNAKQDFMNAAQWVFANNDTDYTMLIAWNHGWGILDPQWNSATKEWEAGTEVVTNSCPIKRSVAQMATYEFHKKYHKGFMFSTTPRIYLNNQDMIEGLGFIKDNLLNGKKLDILAFDTCMAGMLEIAYQVAPYTQYLVGNQACSLRDGFDYDALVKTINNRITPRDMATEMVRIFKNYYDKYDKGGVYAHTALDVAHAAAVTKALDAVIALTLQRNDAATIALKAHRESPRFCLFPMYTDLVSFVSNIEVQLAVDASTVPLKQAIQRFYKAVQPFVVAHCAGYQNTDVAHGFAIYLPTYSIDGSYRKTLFGQQSQWISMLECIEKAAQA